MAGAAGKGASATNCGRAPWDERDVPCLPADAHRGSGHQASRCAATLRPLVRLLAGCSVEPKDSEGSGFRSDTQLGRRTPKVSLLAGCSVPPNDSEGSGFWPDARFRRRTPKSQAVRHRRRRTPQPSSPANSSAVVEGSGTKPIAPVRKSPSVPPSPCKTNVTVVG